MVFRSGLRRLFRLSTKASNRALQNPIASRQLRLESLEDRVLPVTRIWTGALLGSPNWSEPRNWDQNLAPVTGDDLIFPAGGQQLTNLNDFPAGTRFNRITINGSGYNIFGAPVALDAGLYATNLLGVNTFNPALILTTSETVAAWSAVTTLTLNGNISLANNSNLSLDGTGTVLVQGVIGGGNNNSGLVKNGIGTATLAVSNTYLGPTTVAAGTLVAAVNNALGTVGGGVTVSGSSSLSLPGGVSYGTPEPLTLSGGSLSAGAGNTTFTGPITVRAPSSITTAASGSLGLSGPIANNNGLTLAGDGTLLLSGSVTNSGGLTVSSTGTTTISGQVSGIASVNQQGSGVLTLAGNNTYTGTTQISGGTVLVNGTQPSSPVQISGTGTLGGTGTIGGLNVFTGANTVSVAVSPGSPDSAPGTLTVNGNVLLGASTFVADLNGTDPSAYDQLVALGTVNLGSARLDINVNLATAASTTFTLVRSTTGSLIGTFSNFPPGSQLTIAGQTYHIDYSGGQVRLLPLGIPTTTVVASSAPVSAFGQSVTFTALVTASGGTPTGTVTFRDGPTLLGTSALGGGVTSFTTSALAGGIHVITATYNGDATFAASTSPPITQTVGLSLSQAATTTFVTAAPNPAAVGQPVTFTATVTAVAPAAGVPTGTVTFRDGTAVLGSSLLANGTALFTTTTLKAGTHVITAVYEGSSTFLASTSATLFEAIGPSPSPTATSTTVTSSANPSAFGQPVTFSALVTAASGTPTGLVTFKDGNLDLGSSALQNGLATLTTAALLPGTHIVSAVYVGDATFSGSTSAPLVQIVGTTGLTVLVASSANPSVFGQNVTFTATVTGAATVPTGSVVFQDGTTALGFIPLNASGQATFTTATLSQGVHAISVLYLGDANLPLTRSAVLAQTVTTANTTTTVTSSANPALVGQPVTFTITVAPVAPATGTPTGTVRVTIDGTALGTLSLSNGQAAFSLASLANGPHTVSATYSGDATFNPSTSTPLEQFVSTLNQRYVAQLYIDLLGRTVDEAGLASFTQMLNQGVTRQAVSLSILFSAEYRTEVVESLYQNYLQRVADPTGLAAGVGLLGSGGTIEQLKANILGSQEYFQTQGGSTTDGFLNALYLDVLGRPIDPSGEATFSLLLARGFTRTEVALTVVSSVEADTVLVQGYYEAFLGRRADAAGLANFVGQLQHGARDEDVIAAITSSDEYVNQLR